MNNTTAPATLEQFTQLATEDIKYFPGRPRTVKFNAKKGVFLNDHDEPLTKAGASLIIIPLSYRTYVAEMFNMDRREWLELFYLNAAGHVCSLLLHRYSVEQFAALSASLFYEEASPTEIQLEIKPDARSHPEHGKYYVADYSFRVLPEEQRQQPTEILKSLPPVYRRDTALATEQMLTWLGYPNLAAIKLQSGNQPVTKQLPAPSAATKAA